MLRLVVLALVLANAVYFAWAQGFLATYGYAPATQAEPQRMTQQLRPEAVRLLDSAQAKQAENTPAQPAGECLQAGPYTEAQANLLRGKLDSALPAGSWLLQTTTEPGRWIIFMGKYANEEALVKKRGELRALNQSFEPVGPSLMPGLSLGHYSSAAEAERELARAATRGIRTARVVMERPDVTGQLLRLPHIDAALRPRVDALKPQLEGKALLACRSGT